jgi:hypothetical protein
VRRAAKRKTLYVIMREINADRWEATPLAGTDTLPETQEVIMVQSAPRRDLMLAALVSSLPVGFAESAAASPLNPDQTIIRPPGQLQWKPNPAFSEPSVENCPLTGDVNQPGLYYTLVRWWPGFMSAPPSYATDRFCVVVSGTWWCNSGADFDPAACVPVAAGSFVRRVARTPHYDGVVRGHPEPAIIAICGVGPVEFVLSDPSQPGVRRV